MKKRLTIVLGVMCFAAMLANASTQGSAVIQRNGRKTQASLRRARRMTTAVNKRFGILMERKGKRAAMSNTDLSRENLRSNLHRRIISSSKTDLNWIQTIEVVGEKWENANWVNDYKEIETYDANGNLTQLVNQSWDGTNWVNEWREMETYDANGVSIEYVYQEWDGTNWVNFERCQRKCAGGCRRVLGWHELGCRLSSAFYVRCQRECHSRIIPNMGWRQLD